MRVFRCVEAALFWCDIMTFEQLKDKAASLPLAPGVYIMKDKTETVIYVGKAQKLKNRVSQYFVDTVSHSPKTRMMVSKIHEFDVIVAASEFEALILECSLIKRHMPKYNILLKDDKGYPYLRLDMRESYPKITLANKVGKDGAGYYGPFGSRGVSNSLLEAIRHSLKLPDCSRQFPRDIGKERPCLNYHMNLCSGWCQKDRTQEEYLKTMEIAKQLLQGNYKQVTDDIKAQMLEAADALNFELAASLRDRLKSVEALGQKQLVTAGTLADTDVIGFYQSETKACFTVLHFSGGNLLDKDYEIMNPVDDTSVAVSSLIKQYYLSRGYAPRFVLLPCEIEDAGVFEQLLEREYGMKPHLKVPQRGDNVRLVELAAKNAKEEVLRIMDKAERNRSVLNLLGKMLSMNAPDRIESYDISNISGTDIVGSMVVFQEGKPKKSAYKRFKIQDMEGQDDYGSMRQMLTRRFEHYCAADAGFEESPDLLLIDGGVTHAIVAVQVLQELGLSFPVFGMVKDGRHRTRALVTPEGLEINIDTQPSVFALIGSIQEETHRFAITYHRGLRSKRLKYSELDAIPGIGPKRKEELLKTFKSLAGIKKATLYELERILPKDAAGAVYNHFSKQKEM